MSRNALFIARHDLRHAFRRGETILWVFLMPIVFFYFIGTITGGFGGGGETKPRLALRAGADAGFLADQVARRLDERGFEVLRTEDAAVFAATERRLEVPADFTRHVLAGEKVEVRFVGAEDTLEGDYDALKVRRAVYTVLADVAAATERASTVDASALAAVANVPRKLTLEVSSAGREKRPPAGFSQTIPGTLTMFTLLVLLTSGAVPIVVERREGLLRRLASAPISRGEIVLGKWLARLALGLIQVAFAMLSGSLLFRVHWGADLPMVALVLALWAALCASLGILLGSLARSEAQAIGLGVITSNLLAGLGGCWWPIEITPRFMQKLAMFLPTGWTMDALHELMHFGSGAASAAPNALLLAGAAALAAWAAARVFRFQ